VFDNVYVRTMKISLRQVSLPTAIAALFCIVVSTASYAQSSTDQQPTWSGSAEPYLHAVMKQFTTATADGFQGRTSLPPTEFFKLLEFLASARGSIERGRMGMMVDASYLRVGKQFSTNLAGGLFTGAGQITAGMGVYDVAFRYRLGELESDDTQAGIWTVIPYAGVRIIDLWADIDAEVMGPFGYDQKDQGDVERIWAQPLIGISGSIVVLPNLRAFARADAGGFGLAGLQDFSGNAQLGLGYAVLPSLRTNVSWRYRKLAWKTRELPANGLTNDQNGIEVGLKFLF
jgi:hypothetical protein